MKIRVSSLSFILTLTLSAMLAQAQDIHEIDHDEEILSLSVSQKGRQRLLEEALVRGKPLLESFVKSLPFPHQSVGPAHPEDCTEEKIKAMSYEEAYAKCPGIPDYFMKDGGFWKPSFVPRPVVVDVKNTAIKELEFGKPTVVCKGKDCLLEIPLEKFQISSSIDIKSLNSSSKIKAGGSILAFDPLEFRMDKSLNKKEGPTLKIKATLGGTDKGNGSPLIFDVKSSSLNLPPGTMKLHFPEKGDDQMPIGELLNKKGTLDIGSTSLSMLAKVAGAFIKEASLMNQILDLKMPLNGHFESEEKMLAVNQLLNDKLLPHFLRQVNDQISQFPLFKGKEVPALSLSMQDLFDTPKYRKVTDFFHQFLNTYKQDLLQHKAPSFSLGEFQIQGKSLPYFLSAMTISHDPEVLKMVQEMDQALKEIEGLLKKSPHQSKEQGLLEQIQRKLMALTEILPTNISAERAPLLSKVKVIEEGNREDIFKIALVHQGEKSQKSLSTGLICQQGKKENVSDVSGEMGFGFINGQLKELQQLKKLDFCLAEDELLTCTLLQEGERPMKKVLFPQAPQILWDSQKNGHYLSMAVQIPPGPPVHSKIHFKMSPCGDGELCLEAELDFDEGFFEEEKLYGLAAKNILRYVGALIPLAKKIPEFDIPTGKGLKNQTFQQQIHPGVFSIDGLDIVPEGIRIQTHFREK